MQTVDSNGPIRVALVDIQTIFRVGFEALLKSEPGLEFLVAEPDVERLLKAVKPEQVDVVVIGIRPRGESSLDDLRRLTEELPQVAPVVFATSDQEPGLRETLLAGGRGYIRGDSEGDEIVETIKVAGRRRCLQVPVEPLLQILKSLPSTVSGDSAKRAANGFARLTLREREILTAMASEETYRHIAGRLQLAPSTVKKYAHTVITKLGATNRSTAVIQAYRNGLLEP